MAAVRPERGVAASHRGSAPGPSAAGRRPAREVALALAALTVLGASLRLATLGLQSLWLDEVFTRELVGLPVGEMVRRVGDTETTPPLYDLLLWPWVRLFGDGEEALRLPSALLGTACIPLAYLLGRRVRGAAGGLAASALVACNPFLVWFSQEARAYALLVALLAVALLLAPDAARGRRGALVGWTVCAAAALATHFFALFVVAPQLAWLAWRARPRAPVLAAGALVGAAGLALLPMALEQRASGRADEVGRVALLERLVQIPKQFVIGFDSPLPVPLGLLGGALAVVGLVGAARAWRAGRLSRPPAAWTAGAVLAAAALPLALVPAGLDYVNARNVVGALLPLLVLVGAGLSASRAGRLALAGLCAVGLVAVVGVAAQPRYQRDDWRGAARAVGRASAARAVVVSPGQGARALAAYLPDASLMPAAGAQVGEVALVGLAEHGRGGLRAPPRQPGAPLPGLREAGRVQAATYTVIRLVPQAGRAVAVTPQGLLNGRFGLTSYAVLVQPPRP